VQGLGTFRGKKIKAHKTAAVDPVKDIGVHRHNTCIHLQLDQIRLVYQMLGSAKGGHTCWVLIVGEGPHEDLAK